MARDPAIFNGRTALYRLFGADDLLLYIGISRNFAARFAQHAQDKEWWGQVCRSTVVWYPTRDEADRAETAAIVAEKPKHNIAKVSSVSPERLAEIEQRLKDAQAAMAVADDLVNERRLAVAEALAQGWTKYKIAAVLGVRGPTVDSIVKAINREKAHGS